MAINSRPSTPYFCSTLKEFGHVPSLDQQSMRRHPLAYIWLVWIEPYKAMRCRCV